MTAKYTVHTNGEKPAAISYCGDRDYIISTCMRMHILSGSDPWV